MLFVCQRLRVSEREDKLKKLVPLPVRDQYFAKLADYICDVLLDHGYWLLLEPREQQVLCLGLVCGRQLEPEVRDNLAKVDAGDLTDILVWRSGHQNKQVFKSLDAFKVLLEHTGSLLDDFGVGFEQTGQVG